MKNIFRKIGAIFMIAILMLSTSSFSIYKHFCGDKLVKISNYKTIDNCCNVEVRLTSKENCGDKLVEISNYKTVDSCCDVEVKLTSKENLNYSAKDCCKNETSQKNYLQFDSVDRVKTRKGPLVFITSFYLTFIKRINEVTTINSFHKNFSYPILKFDRQVLFQNFLI